MKSHCACSLDAFHRPSSLRILGTGGRCISARRQKQHNREQSATREESNSISGAFTGHHRACEGIHRCTWRRPSSATVESETSTSTPQGSRWHTYCSTGAGAGDIATAMEAVLQMSEADFPRGAGTRLQLALIFVSGVTDQDGAMRTVLQLLRRKYPGVDSAVATVAHGVIGNQPGGPLEVEQTPAVSLTLASFAATSVSTFSVTGDVMPDADASPIEWEGLTGAPLDTEDNLSFVLLAAPTFAGTDDLLQGEAHRPYLRLDFAYPDAAKIGGMVSGPPQRGAGTAESPVGWLIAVERLDPTSSSDAGSVDTYTDAPPLTDTPIEAETAEDLFKGIDALLQQKFADYQSQQAASAGAPGDLPPESELADDEEWVEVVAGDPPASSEGTSGGGGGNAGGGEDVNGRVVRQLIWGGCAGVVLRGSVRIEPLIAQGCRALSGETYSAEKVERGIVLEVAPTSGRSRRTLRPIEALERELRSQAGQSEAEIQRMARNLTVAVAPDDFKAAADLEPQDFLVRGIMGFDQSSGAMAVGGGLRLGQRLRFMVRDREGAKQDLREHALALKRRELQATVEARAQAPPLGLLIFSCNGRGQALYGEPNYDSSTLASFVPVPASGMFCNGEIGQVGKSTYLHGFTAAVGILREKQDAEGQ